MFNLRIALLLYRGGQAQTGRALDKKSQSQESQSVPSESGLLGAEFFFPSFTEETEGILQAGVRKGGWGGQEHDLPNFLIDYIQTKFRLFSAYTGRP